MSVTKVEVSDEARAEAKARFGRDLTDEDFAGLIGAPAGATITVDRQPTGTLAMLAKHPLYVRNQEVYIATAESGASFIWFSLIHLVTTAPAEMGTRIFARMVEKGRELGLEAIHIPEASRNDAMGAIGYYVWPRFGADFKIPDAKRQLLPANLASATRLSDLMQSEEGIRWWKVNGYTTPCTFTLTPGSLSLQIWEKYRKEKGI